MSSAVDHLQLPDSLLLSELPSSGLAGKNGKYQRGIRVALLDGNVSDLVQAIRDSEGAQVSLGRKPAIFLDEKRIRPINPLANERCFVYGRGSESKRARLTGVLSLKNAAAHISAHPSQDLDLNDPAFLGLQQSYAELAQKKQNNTYVLEVIFS